MKRFFKACRRRLSTSVRKTIRFWAFVFEHFNLDNCFSTAAALAFATVLSLVPLMVVSVTILRMTSVSNKWSQQATDFIFNNFVPTTGEVVQQYLQTFMEQSAHLTGLGAVFLTFTALMMLFTMENVFNTIWRVPRQRRGMAAVLVYGAVLILTPLFLVGSIALSSYFFSMNFFLEVTSGEQRSRWLTVYVPFLLTTGGLTFLYAVMPNRRVKIRYALFGGIVAAILFELSKRGFSIYIANFPTYQVLYGALAAIPIFLFWIYLAWVVILFGAEVAHALGAPYRISPVAEK